MKKLLLVPVLFALAACRQEPAVEWVASTMEHPWQVMETSSSAKEAAEVVVVDPAAVLQAIEGFGTCFNELGWTSLSALSEADRAAILQDLFTPDGANFTMGRMPLGANDFSVDFYSYDEVDGDFALEHFSIDRDRESLIPFIKAALARKPWAS